MTSRLMLFFDSDLAYSFRRSPVTVISGSVALLLCVAAIGAPWLAPHDPGDLASLSLADSFKPPIGMAATRHRVPAPSVQPNNSGPKPIENMSILTPQRRATQ